LFSQYEEYGEEFVDMLDGMFSFVLLDTRDKSFIAARDAIGICPLYMGWGLDGMQRIHSYNYFFPLNKTMNMKLAFVSFQLYLGLDCWYGLLGYATV
jgi:asparagine synthetase B (glutamine-hydrolysing)